MQTDTHTHARAHARTVTTTPSRYRDRMQVFKNTLGFIGSYGVYWVVAATLRISVFVISRKNVRGSVCLAQRQQE